MEEKIQAVLLIAELREQAAEKMRQGLLPDPQLLEVMAGLLETVAQAFRLRLNNSEWEQFYCHMHSGYIAADFFDRLQQWEEEVYQMIRQDMEEGVCNICKKTVNYHSSSDYFCEQQKKHGFPYWNAVFESVSRRYRACPICQSLDRDRMISLFLDMLKPTEGKKLKVLHIAPSHALNRYLEQRDDIEYETTDLCMEDVNFNADIQDMPIVQDKTYDIIICSHILEHVKDDRKALIEIKRILKEDGICIFLVPLVVGLDETDEAFGLSADENWKRFGQDDHVRLYGRTDFLNRLTQSGYCVYILKEDYFGKEIWRRNGLSDIHCLYAASKKDIGLGVKPYQMEGQDEELVSVVIPTFNREKLIERSVRSVLNQTYKQLEVIVVDDASADHTEDVIQKIEDTRIRYIRLKENSGANYARNVGVKTAKGRYVAFNDSDDEWLPTKLAKQMKLMRQSESENVGCVYCLMTRYFHEIPTFEEPQVIPDLERIGENAIGDLFHFMQSCMFISTQMLLLKKEVIEKAGYFNEDLRCLQDWEFLLRVAQKCKFTLIQESLVNDYVQKDRITTNVKGLVDTIRYVIQLYSLDKTNVKAYECLIMNGVVDYMRDAVLSEEYKKKVVVDIEQDNVFSNEVIQNIRKVLNIGPGVSDKRECGDNISEMLLPFQLEVMQNNIEQNNRMLHEILWAQVFNSSINEYTWLPNDIALWPGRWAVGYQYMYVVSRMLNAVHPRNILETGLGQSTRLTGSYVKYMSKKCKCRHIVIEHDQDWIDKFCQEFTLSDDTQIVQRDLGVMQINAQNGASMTYAYMNFDEVIKKQKFDFISLDGPYGTDESVGYSRVDILNYIPECLNDDFCIILDDFNRNGEKNTMQRMKEILSVHHIKFFETVYRGMKDLYVLTSENWKFLCTL